MCMDHDGNATVLHSRQQRAKINHKCRECRRVIEAGEVYTTERVLFDGSMWTHKVCAHCVEVRGYLGEHCGGWVYDAIEEDIQGHFYGSTLNDAETRELRLLAIGIAERWRRANGALWPIPNSGAPKAGENLRAPAPKEQP